MALTFSPANPALLAALHAACFDAPWTEDEFGKLLAGPGVTALLAAEGDEPVGFVLARRAADEAEIVTIGVKPTARQRGVARALLDYQLRDLRGAGAIACFIEVAQSNAAALRLYEATEFRPAGQRRNYYERGNGSREDALVLRRDLKP